jgi:hypothetical protein
MQLKDSSKIPAEELQEALMIQLSEGEFSCFLLVFLNYPYTFLLFFIYWPPNYFLGLQSDYQHIYLALAFFNSFG